MIPICGIVIFSVFAFSSLVVGAPKNVKSDIEINSLKSVIEDGPYGGNGGSHWTDGNGVNLNGQITAIELRSGSEIDAIRARYGETWGEWHGGGGGSIHTFELNAGAVFNIVQGCTSLNLNYVNVFPNSIQYLLGRHGDRIDSIEFISSDGVVYGPYGGSGGSPFVSARPECALSYLSGNAGKRLDSLTLHYEC